MRMFKTAYRVLLIGLVSIQALNAQDTHAFLGFDRNDYPGDENLTTLHKTFSFAGYWLNNPPGGISNTWGGKRRQIESVGFGFLVLFNGRMYADLKSVDRATQLGGSDAQTAVANAKREGFPHGTVIF